MSSRVRGHICFCPSFRAVWRRPVADDSDNSRGVQGTGKVCLALYFRTKILVSFTVVSTNVMADASCCVSGQDESSSALWSAARDYAALEEN